MPKPSHKVRVVHDLAKTREGRRELYKKYRLSGLNMRESAELAGYSPATAKCMAKYKVEREVKQSLAKYLDRAGLTDQKISESLADIALNGKKHLVVDKSVREVDDPHVRLKALDLASTLKGHKTERNLSMNQTQVNVIVKFPNGEVIDV